MLPNQFLVLGAPDEGCAGKHGRSIPLAERVQPVDAAKQPPPPEGSQAATTLTLPDCVNDGKRLRREAEQETGAGFRAKLADGRLRPPDQVPPSLGVQCRWKAAGSA